MLSEQPVEQHSVEQNASEQPPEKHTVEQHFLLPDVGEGLTEAEIVSWMVKPGDTVTVNQNIVDIETAKSVVALPCPYAGVVSALHAAEGDTVEVGRPIISVLVGAAATGTPSATSIVGPASEKSPAEVSPSESSESSKLSESSEQAALLVGYGPRPSSLTRRSRLTNSSPTSPPTMMPAPATHSGARNGGPVVASTPPVRKLAKDLGIEISSLIPTGLNGTVTRADVQRADAERSGNAAPSPASETSKQTEPARTADRETRVPIRGIRKHTAAAMVRSAFTAPHVTEFITFDITATMDLRQRVSARPEFKGIKLSPLAFVAKALLLAIRQTPEANSSWDENAQEMIFRNYVNLGIAAATDHGLVVPNIKDAEQLSLLQLATALTDLAETARARRTSPSDMTDGTITITNVGVFGVDTGTPILNPGEAAILAFGAVRRMPWVINDEAGERIEPRWVTQLALSFDHRLMDGQQGSEFLARIAGLLSDPALAIL